MDPKTKKRLQEILGTKGSAVSAAARDADEKRSTAASAIFSSGPLATVYGVLREYESVLREAGWRAHLSEDTGLRLTAWLPSEPTEGGSLPSVGFLLPDDYGNVRVTYRLRGDGPVVDPSVPLVELTPEKLGDLIDPLLKVIAK